MTKKTSFDNIVASLDLLNMKIEKEQKLELKKMKQNITHKEYLYLRLINTMNGYQISEIRKQLTITKATLSTQLKILLRKKFIKIEVDEKDRRSKRVALTSAGQKVVSINLVIQKKINKIVNKHFTEKEKKIFSFQIGTIANILD